MYVMIIYIQISIYMLICREKSVRKYAKLIIVIIPEVATFTRLHV